MTSSSAPTIAPLSSAAASDDTKACSIALSRASELALANRLDRALFELENAPRCASSEATKRLTELVDLSLKLDDATRIVELDRTLTSRGAATPPELIRRVHEARNALPDPIPAPPDKAAKSLQRVREAEHALSHGDRVAARDLYLEAVKARAPFRAGYALLRAAELTSSIDGAKAAQLLFDRALVAFEWDEAAPARLAGRAALDCYGGDISDPIWVGWLDLPKGRTTSNSESEYLVEDCGVSAIYDVVRQREVARLPVKSTTLIRGRALIRGLDERWLPEISFRGLETFEADDMVVLGSNAAHSEVFFFDGATLRLWDVASRKAERTIPLNVDSHPEPCSQPTHAALSPDGKSIAIGTRTGQICMFDDQNRFTGIIGDDTFSEDIVAIEWSSDRKMITAFGDANANGAHQKTWSLANGSLRHQSPFQLPSRSADGKTEAVETEHGLTIHDAAGKRLAAISDGVFRMAMSPSGRFFAGVVHECEEGCYQLAIWDVKTGKRVHPEGDAREDATVSGVPPALHTKSYIWSLTPPLRVVDFSSTMSGPEPAVLELPGGEPVDLTSAEISIQSHSKDKMTIVSPTGPITLLSPDADRQLQCRVGRMRLPLAVCRSRFETDRVP